MAYDEHHANWDTSPTKSAGLADSECLTCSQEEPIVGIMMANIQGLSTARNRHKLAVLGETAVDENICIISLTETHLDNTYLEAEISLDGFESFRSDRAMGQRRGGVITYLRNDLDPGTKILKSGSVGNVEFQILFIKKVEILYIVIYRPPSTELVHLSR